MGATEMRRVLEACANLDAECDNWREVVEAKNAQIAELKSALEEIARMKPEPIGTTGFFTGPLALLNACQRIAKEALRKSRRAS